MITGPAATAEQFLDHDDKYPATLSSWMINAPGQSPAWSDYLLSVIHLRDVDSLPPANIRTPGSTHEILLVALDPDKNPQAGKPETIVPLLPANAEVQFLVDSDEMAIELAIKAVECICNGIMPAEPPLSHWLGWEEAIIASAEHLRKGYHK